MQGIPGMQGIQGMQGMPMFGGYPGMGLSSGGFQMGPGGMIVFGNQQGQKK